MHSPGCSQCGSTLYTLEYIYICTSSILGDRISDKFLTHSGAVVETVVSCNACNNLYAIKREPLELNMKIILKDIEEENARGNDAPQT